jgi:glucuronosyltransferase
MLGIPMFAEQGWNCARAEHKGIALCLDLMTFSADQLHSYIRELIDNATYRINVRRLSEIWRDEPMIGREKAGFWINHVIKYGGAHLRSPSLDQSVYEFLMLDILAVLLIVCLVFAVLIVICCNLLVTRFRRWVGVKRKAE